MKERLHLMDEVERETWRKQQSKNSQKESICAKCGEELNPLALKSTYKGGFHVTWRIPIENGGLRTTNNCILLCNKCYQEFRGENNTKEIPLRELPYYNG
jgi:hypothetical protein